VLAAGQSLNAAQNIPREVLLRDAVLLLQGVDGQYARFQDSSPDIVRDHKGLPLHPLEQDYAEIPIQGQLLFVGPSNTVSLVAFKKIPNIHVSCCDFLRRHGCQLLLKSCSTGSRK
jgi:hypothetical protein